MNAWPQILLSGALGAIAGAVLPVLVQQRQRAIGTLDVLLTELEVNLQLLDEEERAWQESKRADAFGRAEVRRTLCLHMTGFLSVASELGGLRPQARKLVLVAYAHVEMLAISIARQGELRSVVESAPAASFSFREIVSRGSFDVPARSALRREADFGLEIGNDLRRHIDAAVVALRAERGAFANGDRFL